MLDDIRVLLLADTHLGFDLPVQARVQRRRRGQDFLANYVRALAPAFAGEVDLVVHAGDVFNRSRVLPSLAFQAYEPLRRVADLGVPVFVVPGNHERSRLPHARLLTHPHVHVFDEPRTYRAVVRGTTVALSGFPFERNDVRTRFGELVRQTCWTTGHAAVRLLCMHQCVEGATVGPANHVFRSASDVVRHRDVPREFDAVLSGHIHRHQVLTSDLANRSLETPVLYPGSVERTSVAEIDEPKGYLLVHAREAAKVRWRFHEMPARPMIRADFDTTAVTAAALRAAVGATIAAAPLDAVLSIRVSGTVSPDQWRVLSSSGIRALAPPTMNVEISPVHAWVTRRGAGAPPTLERLRDPELLPLA